MRPWCHIFLLLLAIIPYALSSQVSFATHQQNVTILSTNIVDALSNDSDYTSLLRLLQRAKLIPTLNKLNGSTLFAPTNDAIEKHLGLHSVWREALKEPSSDLRDNVQEQLRQELFYHLLNYTLPILPKEKNPQVLKTLHYPRKPSSGPPTHDPPPSPPWLPVPGGTLGGAPQRLRIAARDEKIYVGVNAFGDGGAEVIKPSVNTSNGLVLGIGTMLEVPPDLAIVIKRHTSLKYLTKILIPEIVSFLNGTSELTLFLPVDSAWEALPFYERLYLESKFATDDLTRIVNMHAVVRKNVTYSEQFEKGLHLKTIHGPTLDIAVDSESGKTMVSSAELVEPDIYASNGVLHTVSSLLVPPGSLRLTPEKYLLVLNCTSFVSLLHSVNLTPLVNDTEASWTILAPKDDVIELFGDDHLPERGSEELRKLLRYHFIPGKLTPKKLKDGMLVETALEEPGLDGGKQVLPVGVSTRGKKETLSLSFGEASVIGEAVEINNSLIYFVSHPLTPPVDALQTALPSLDLSSFLAAVFSAGLADYLNLTPRTTFLIPHNSAFKRLGLLVSAHLLSVSSKSDLERVIKHHVLNDVEYADQMQNGSQHTYGTLEGTDVHIDRTSTVNKTLLLSGSGGWPEMHSELKLKNTLTQTGVIHEVSDILIPRSVELTVGKLVRAGKGSTMATMMNKAGLDWILNGTAPPEGSAWADLGLSGVGWTLLCPTDDAFKGVNLTALYADSNRVRAIVSQHLIPTQRPSQDVPEKGRLVDDVNKNRPLTLDDATTYTTLQSAAALYGDVVFRQTEDSDDILVGIKGARGDNGRREWARVLAWGRSTTGGGTGGVIQIDRPLVPYSPSWWNAYGAPIGVGIVGSILIGLFFLGVRAIWRRDTTEATYEPIGGFAQEEEDP